MRTFHTVIAAAAAALAVAAAAASAAAGGPAPLRVAAVCRITAAETAAGNYPGCSASGTVARPAGLWLRVRVNQQATIEKSLADASHGGFRFTTWWGESCSYRGHKEVLRSGMIMVSPAGSAIRVPLPGRGTPSSCQVNSAVRTTVALTAAMLRALKKAGIIRVIGSDTVTARTGA